MYDQSTETVCAVMYRVDTDFYTNELPAYQK
jgi:hypothetical protein